MRRDLDSPGAVSAMSPPFSRPTSPTHASRCRTAAAASTSASPSWPRLAGSRASLCPPLAWCLSPGNSSENGSACDGQVAGGPKPLLWPHPAPRATLWCLVTPPQHCLHPDPSAVLPPDQPRPVASLIHSFTHSPGKHPWSGLTPPGAPFCPMETKSLLQGLSPESQRRAALL